jgi:O-methyltransferase involved in polyketide biosynthesis
VARTLLIPLYARAHAAELLPEVRFADPIARSVADGLSLRARDVGRDRFTMRLCVARSVVLQQMLADILGQRADRPVVLLACGMDTLPQRLAGTGARWLCADLADVMTLRGRLLPACGDVEHAVVRLPDDLDALAGELAGARPVFVLEGVLPYLEPAQVAATLAALSALAPAGGDLLVDGYHPALLAFARFADGLRRMRVRFRFGIADTRAYERLAPRLRHRAETDLLALLPFAKRLRTLPPALAAGGRCLASIAHLEILPA